jgi:hypothetical protein
MAERKKKWISGAIEHEGALTRAAKRAHQTPLEYAREHQDEGGTRGRRSRLALTLNKLRKKG